VLRAVTPPRDSFFVRVPTGTADSAAAALAAMPREDVRGLIVVESKKGESVASIAKKHGVTTRAVNLYNQKLTRLKSGNLAAGQLVYVPTTEVARVSISVPDPEIERYGSSSSGSTVTHVVRRGETLGGIALKYHTTTAALMTANGLRKPLIFAGQSLIVKGKASSTKSAPKRSTASKAAPKSSGKTSVAKKAPAKPTASKSTTAKASTAKTAKPASKPASTKASSAKSAAKTASKSPSKHNESH
jgi:LysM repeat protein